MHHLVAVHSDLCGTPRAQPLLVSCQVVEGLAVHAIFEGVLSCAVLLGRQAAAVHRELPNHQAVGSFHTVLDDFLCCERPQHVPLNLLRRGHVPRKLLS